MTNEAITYLLLPDNNELSPKQKKLLEAYKLTIITANTYEDSDFRDFNHFYDPIHNSPLTDPIGLVAAIGYPVSLQTAKDWANNSSYNIYNYTKSKDKFIGAISTYNPDDPATKTKSLDDSMDGLGRLLHNFQDMASPNHTRNDYAALWAGGGYETYVENNGLPFWQKETELIRDDNELWTKFHKLALFTNSNFLSECTLPIPNQPHAYDLPVIPPSELTHYGYLNILGNDISVHGGIYRGYNYPQNKDEYTISMPNIHRTYSTKLVPQSINYSIGVIKYFLNLKTTGKVVINSHTDGQHVASTPITVSGYLTYYAPEVAISIPNGTAIRTVVHASTTLSGGHYAFSYPVNLYSGSNQITVTADNENVEATSATITVIYGSSNPGGNGNPAPKPGGSNGGGNNNIPFPHPPYSPAVQGLFDNNPGLGQCVAGNASLSARINPNAAGSPVPFAQIAGWYLTYQMMLDRQDGKGWVVNDYFAGANIVKARPPESATYINPAINEPIFAWGYAFIPLSGVGPYYQKEYQLTDSYEIKGNDPCFQGLQVPSDLFSN